MPKSELDHGDVEEQLQEEMDWPQYFVSGEGVDIEDFMPAYYRVEGPNGPVSYMNPNSGIHPTTMYDFAMEARSDTFRYCKKEETPFAKRHHELNECNQVTSINSNYCPQCGIELKGTDNTPYE